MHELWVGNAMTPVSCPIADELNLSDLYRAKVDQTSLRDEPVHIVNPLRIDL